jgi:aromatic-L-amino-acid/L-tryptophan decarboxylase
VVNAYSKISTAALQDSDPAFAAVADADSVIVDPHKWLATGVGCAATYVRDAGPLLRAFAQGAAAYLEGSFSSEEDDAVVQFDSIGIPYMDMGVELSAPSRGVLAWVVLRELGRAGVAARVERHIGFARRGGSGEQPGTHVTAGRAAARPARRTTRCRAAGRGHRSGFPWHR